MCIPVQGPEGFSREVQCACMGKASASEKKLLMQFWIA